MTKSSLATTQFSWFLYKSVQIGEDEVVHKDLSINLVTMFHKHVCNVLKMPVCP